MAKCSNRGCKNAATYLPRVKLAEREWQSHGDKAVCADHAEFACAKIAKASGKKEPVVQLIPV